MHVWRIPIASFAGLVAGGAVAVLVLLLSILGSRGRTTLARLTLVAGGAAGIIGSPFLIRLIAHQELAFLARHGVWTRWSAPVYWLPGALAVLILILALWLFPDDGQGYRFARWRFALLGVCFVFAILNVANWCSPGWCARYGFPFSYSWWSDAIAMFNGENLRAGISILAAIGNALVVGAAIFALARSYRKRLRASA